jgi:hypothetical protein
MYQSGPLGIIKKNSIRYSKVKAKVKAKMKARNPKELDDDEKSESDDLNNSVYCSDNHIYFYADVNTKNILYLNHYIRQLNVKYGGLEREMNLRYGLRGGSGGGSGMKIYLHINSYGGYITDALAGVDTIKESVLPIVSIIEGCAASAATLLSVVAQRREITRHSSMLIHQLSGGFWGTYEQMKDDMKNCDYLEELTSKIYLDHTHKKLKKKKLKKYLQRDILWDACKCKTLGLVDAIRG